MRTIKIGRGSNNDVVINDDVISTSHAAIVVSDFGEISIEDLNSKNGTFVNGKKLPKLCLHHLQLWCWVIILLIGNK